MLLLRGATGAGFCCIRARDVSIHAPLARSNLLQLAVNWLCSGFNTCSSCEEQRLKSPLKERRIRFNTCSSCEEQLWIARMNSIVVCFNTCSSCEEQLDVLSPLAVTATVSIHAPLARSNLHSAAAASDMTGFNTCSSCEEQQAQKLGLPVRIIVSIHAPLARSNTTAPIWRRTLRFNTCSSCEEQRHFAGMRFSTRCCFNTCSSCEEQLPSLATASNVKEFQYMLLLRGATLFVRAQID